MEIEPFSGIGVVRFGNTRKQVRDAIRGPFHTFHKGVGENETDAFDELGVHIYYDDEDRVEFIEAFGSASLTIGGRVLLGRNTDEVDRELNALGYSSCPTDVGLRYDSAGVILTAPNGVVEGVGVYTRGYYDS